MKGIKDALFDINETKRAHSIRASALFFTAAGLEAQACGQILRIVSILRNSSSLLQGFLM